MTKHREPNNKAYTYPSEHEQWRAKAKRRRIALAAAGCSTYALGTRNGQGGIVCLCCGLGSSNATDIAQRYCGFCREFHSEWKEEGS